MIFYIFTWLMALGLPTLGCLTFWKVEHFYDIYRPVVLFIAGAVGSMVFLFIVCYIIGFITVNMKKEYQKPSRFHRFIINNGMAYIRRLAGIVVKVKGKEKLPKNGSVLVVSNHRSNFDNFLLSEKFFMHRDIAFISKPSNFKIPIVGFFMTRLLYLKIDKNDLLQSLEVIKKATNLMANDVTSIGVFPEGTRSKDGKTMGEFHEGVFNIAIRSKSPIVVCSVNGTEKVHKRFPRLTKVDVHILQVLTYEDYAGLPAKQLSDNVKAMIMNDLNK